MQKRKGAKRPLFAKSSPLTLDKTENFIYNVNNCNFKFEECGFFQWTRVVIYTCSYVAL